jgi:hypothetical protein
MTNNNENNLTKAQRRTNRRREKRNREQQARDAAKCAITPRTVVPAAPKPKGELSSAERRALSRVPALTPREITEIRETNEQATIERLKVSAQREVRLKVKSEQRRNKRQNSNKVR